MLRRPSSQRRTRTKEDIELLLVPILDTFVTLIAFLLAATSLLSVTLIDTPVPVVSATPPEIKQKPLSLTIKIELDRFVLSSPFNRIRKQNIDRVGDDQDFVKLHDALLAIKGKYPYEKQIVLMPSPTMEYEDIVKVMDASRRIEEGDPSLYVKEAVKDEFGEEIRDKSGSVVQEDRIVTDLFPEVVFGNILGGA